MEITSGEGLVIVLLFVFAYFMYHVLMTTKSCVKEQKDRKNYIILKFKYSFKSDDLYSILVEQKEQPLCGKLYFSNRLDIDVVRNYNMFASTRLASCTEGNISLDDFLATGEYLHNVMVLSNKVGLITPDCLEHYSVANLSEVMSWLCNKPRGREPMITVLPTSHLVEFEDTLLSFRKYIDKCNHYSGLLKPIVEMEKLIFKAKQNNKLTRA